MEIYDAIRRPIGNGVIEKSRVTGRLVQLSAPGLEDIAEGDEKVSIDRLRGIVEEHMKSFEWVWKEPIKYDRERALVMLKDLEKVRTSSWSIANASLISLTIIEDFKFLIIQLLVAIFNMQIAYLLRAHLPSHQYLSDRNLSAMLGRTKLLPDPRYAQNKGARIRARRIRVADFPIIEGDVMHR